MTVKNQHYVAQGYLRSFADDREKFFVFDKKDQKVFNTIVRNVASEKFFYDLPPRTGEQGGDPQAVETFLAQTVDADFPGAIRKLLDGVKQDGRIDPGLKTPMGCFLAVQLLSTRAKRNVLTQMSQLIATELQNRGGQAGLGIDPEKFRLDEKGAAAVQARSFLDPMMVGHVASVLSGHYWVVGARTGKRAFYTSDNPVVKKGNASHPTLSMEGLASPGIEIAFPLTPKFVLLLYERTYFREQVGKHDLQAIPVDEKCVEHCNIMQVLGSCRQVYCPADDFDLARNLCGMHPKTCDPDRVGIEIVGGGNPPRK